VANLRRLSRAYLRSTANERCQNPRQKHAEIDLRPQFGIQPAVSHSPSSPGNPRPVCEIRNLQFVAIMMGKDVRVLVIPRLSAPKCLVPDVVGIMDVFILLFQVGVPAIRCDTITHKLEIFVKSRCQVQNADKGQSRECQWPNTTQAGRRSHGFTIRHTASDRYQSLPRPHEHRRYRWLILGFLNRPPHCGLPNRLCG